MIHIDYKAEVLKIYPDAFVDWGDIDDYHSYYWITTPKLDQVCNTIGKVMGNGKDAAWQSAYEQLKKEGKI